MKNLEIPKYESADRFWWKTMPRALRRRLRRRTDVEQMQGEANLIVHEGVTLVKTPVFDSARHMAIGTNKRRAIVAALVGAGLATWITLAPPGGLLFEVVSVALGGSIALAAAFAAAAWKFRNDPGLPMRLTPKQVDDHAVWLRQLGEIGRSVIGVWESIGTYALVSAEALVVFLLSRTMLFPTMQPVHAMLASLVLAMASGLVLVEAVGFLAVAIRKGSVRDLQALLAESDNPAHKARAVRIQEAYDAAVGGHWFIGTRLIGHQLRCYREAIVIGLLLAAGFAGTVALRVAVALDDPGDLMALAVTAGIALATLLLATKRRVGACDLTDHVGLARRVVHRFPDGVALEGYLVDEERRIRGRLLEVQLVMQNAWAPTVPMRGALQVDLVTMFDDELARHAASTSKAAQEAAPADTDVGDAAHGEDGGAGQGAATPEVGAPVNGTGNGVHGAEAGIWFHGQAADGSRGPNGSQPQGHPEA